MERFSSARAKQCFGQLLKAASEAPVAIERHGKVRAIVGAPEFFSPAQAGHDELAVRRLARLNQAMTEKDRLIRHQRIALDLVTLHRKARDDMIRSALAIVDRWRQEHLCSRDYIDRWSEILRLPARKMATAMISDLEGWGTALRQNSPWVGVHT